MGENMRCIFFILLACIVQSCAPRPSAESDSLIANVRHYFETLENSPSVIRKNIEMQSVIAQEPIETREKA